MQLMKFVEPENDGHEDIWHKKDLKQFYKFTQQPSPIVRSPIRSPKYDSELGSEAYQVMQSIPAFKPSKDPENRNSRQEEQDIWKTE